MTITDPGRPGGPAVTRERRRIDAEAWVDVDDRTGDADRYGPTMTADFAAAYRDGADRWSDEAALRRTTAFLVDALGGDVRGRSVLDVGCGRGADVAALVELGADVLGVDLVEVPDWRDVARRLPRARFAPGDLVELVARTEVPPAAFDAVLDNGCLHHQHPDRVRGYLEAVRAALAPDGLFVVSVFAAPGESGVLMQNAAGRIFRDFGPDELDGWAHAGGFDPVARHDVPRADGLAYRVAVWRRRGERR